MSKVRKALRLTALAMEVKAKESPPFTFRFGTIASVTAGASTDGVAAATVNVGGSTIPAPYLSSYTPAPNERVLVLLLLGSPLIIGKVIGLPSF